MIETALRRPEPNYNPVRREPQAWRRQSASVIERAASEDDIFQDTRGKEARKRVCTGNEAEENPRNGYDGERFLGLQDTVNEQGDSARGRSVRKGQGDLLLDTDGPLKNSRGSAVKGDVAVLEAINGSGDTFQEDMPMGLSSETSHLKQSENHKHRQSQVDSTSQTNQKEKIVKLSPQRIHELTSTPDSFPLRALISTDSPFNDPNLPPPSFDLPAESQTNGFNVAVASDSDVASAIGIEKADKKATQNTSNVSDGSVLAKERLLPISRPAHAARAFSTPSGNKSRQSAHFEPGTAHRRASKHTPTPLRFEDGKPGGLNRSTMADMIPSPMPESIPLPPMSLPTYLQLELSSHRPSPLYIHRSVTSDFPYESSRVKIERLLNFLLLPPQLEQVLWFGTFACLDAWLYTFTILPLRLLKSFYILGQSWATNFAREVHYVAGFIYAGTGRMWKRRRTRGNSASKPNLDNRGSICSEKIERPEPIDGSIHGPDEKRRPSLNQRNTTDESGRRLRRHRRIKSVPSSLLPDDKADILKGLLIISTCLILMRLDASRMYHWIRGQAAIKLYVIYNVLEVGDRLLSAIGQDVLECLFSREALERGPDGHSKVLRPFWLFLLALAYTVVHATALFYQVITLNVAVNSYSNALITLLMSNQFVEIKSTVFKKFEKENLFQLTCADVVERFQLWLMLLIIASRNIVETGGLSAGLSAFGGSSAFFSPTATNSSHPSNQPPPSSASILPRSFTLLPNILSSLTAYAPGISHVLGPFLVVLGSEMLVDWLKHSYINKFNNTRPAIYGRFLDVLAKDYYSNAFAEQNLTKRLGLPVIPLSCLFIRASVQTYHMFLAAWVPASLPSSSSSAATELSSRPSPPYSASAPSSPPSTTAAALSHYLDELLRRVPTSSRFPSLLIFLLGFLILVTLKLLLGMLLLAFARARYRRMKEREKNPIHHVEGGRRVGGWGVVEVDDDKRRWIYEGDEEGRRQLVEREARERAKRERERGVGAGEGGAGLDWVKRYEMVAKRIW